MSDLENKKILVDMSPLDTPSRLRGVGQYIIGLTDGIRELQAEGNLGFSIEGLARFDLQGQSTGADGLDYRGSLVHPDGYKWKVYRKHKENAIDRAAHSRGGDLLHVTEPEALIRENRVPRILTCYDLIPLIFHKEYLGRAPWARLRRHFKDKSYYRTGRRIIAISEATKRDLVEYLDIREDIIDVTYLGVDHDQYQAKPKSEHERIELMQRHELKRPFLLYLGAYDARKNVPLLVRAYAASGLDKEFDLVLAGAIHRTTKRNLQQTIEKSGVSKTTRIIGFVDQEDVAPFYRSCHVHVFPSKYEGFGLPVAEAMACGAPTIATTASSIPEVAGDGAVLVPASDCEALAAALRSLAHNDAHRAELRIAGPKVAAHFQWRECAKQTVAAYRKALLMGYK